MKRFIQSTIRALFAIAVLMFGGTLPSFAADFQMFSNARLIDNPTNDGDSFIVEANGESLRVRLYFVDCPETLFSFNSDTQRVREQTRYFGLTDASRAVHFGNEAKTFVERVLVKPFTVHTAFASALGRSAKGRVYGLVTTADGNDLASLLVKNGFARTHGTGRKTPDGVSRDEMVERLRDFEISAMLKRVGVWSESDPDRLAELRAKQRSEDKELKEIQIQIQEAQAPQSLLDLNTASKKELQSIKGIGPVTATAIIDGRPYKSIDDLLKVKGVGPKTLETIRPYLKR
jgi:competence protein ComEA